MSLEYCEICGEPTGQAGRYDDSLVCIYCNRVICDDCSRSTYDDVICKECDLKIKLKLKGVDK